MLVLSFSQSILDFSISKGTKLNVRGACFDVQGLVKKKNSQCDELRGLAS